MANTTSLRYSHAVTLLSRYLHLYDMHSEWKIPPNKQKVRMIQEWNPVSATVNNSLPVFWLDTHKGKWGNIHLWLFNRDQSHTPQQCYMHAVKTIAKVHGHAHCPGPKQNRHNYNYMQAWADIIIISIVYFYSIVHVKMISCCIAMEASILLPLLEKRYEGLQSFETSYKQASSSPSVCRGWHALCYKSKGVPQPDPALSPVRPVAWQRTCTQPIAIHSIPMTSSMS